MSLRQVRFPHSFASHRNLTQQSRVVLRAMSSHPADGSSRKELWPEFCCKDFFEGGVRSKRRSSEEAIVFLPTLPVLPFTLSLPLFHCSLTLTSFFASSSDTSIQSAPQLFDHFFLRASSVLVTASHHFLTVDILEKGSKAVRD